ncbi:MAG: hypothetical protein L0228_13800 [Planctomycetes bacterium]|nr:hypothetical protein [Planctomycetota bacterium]
MKNWQLLISVVAVFVISISTNVRAASIVVSIDGVSQEAPTFTDPDTGFIVVGTPTDPRFVMQSPAGDRLEVGGYFDPDPFIIFSGAVIDAGAPSTFGYTYILPLAPTISNPSVVLDSLSGSVTNGAAPGGVTVTAVAPPAGIPVDGDGVAEIQVFTLSDDGGVTYKNVKLDSGPTTTTPLDSFDSGGYGVYNQGPIATIAGGPWTHMRADINFMLSGGGDAFSFNGAKAFGPPGSIPEPGTLLLALLSFGAACVCRWRSVR